MKFPYKKFTLPLGERREFLLKPLIPIYLLHKKHFVRMEALIDSGADFCLFHREIADVLNISWKNGTAHHFIGVTGKKGIVYFHTVQFRLGKWTREISIGFSNDLSETNYGVLGQEGFFEQFDVTFSLPKEQIRIAPAKR